MGRAMTVTRRRFLTEVAAAGGTSLAYEAMTALGLLAAPSQADFNLAGAANKFGPCSSGRACCRGR